MEITEVRVFLRESGDKKLKAYATVTFDNCFVVREVKVIEGNKGLFVAMPSRRVRESCSKCGQGNPVRSKFCAHCGGTLVVAPRSIEDAAQARQSEHRDIAHPINPEFREYLQTKVLNIYEEEKARGGGGTRTPAAPAPAAAAPSVAPEPIAEPITPAPAVETADLEDLSINPPDAPLT